MSEAEEWLELERGLETLGRLGVQPEGYRTPSWEPSWRTAALVAEYGLAYDSSLAGDDRPYVLETGSGEFVELTGALGLHDRQPTAHLPPPPPDQHPPAQEGPGPLAPQLQAY